MEHGLPKWVLPAAIAGVVLLLVLRGKSAGGATTTGARATPASDPLRQAAQALQIQQQQQDAARQNALAGIQTTAEADQLVLTDCKKLFADPAYACPGGGRPRVVATNQWPYVGCGCIAPRTGAITLGSVTGFAAQLYRAFGLGTPSGGGGFGDYNASNDVPAPSQSASPLGPPPLQTANAGYVYNGNLPV
jgi:hypothetical protein